LVSRLYGGAIGVRLFAFILVTVVSLHFLVNLRFKTRPPTQDQSVFVLLVNIKFQDVATKNEFKTIFRPIAAHVSLNEPDTLSYEVADSDQDPASIVIIERYKTRQAYADVHRHSEPFIMFKAKMGQLDDVSATKMIVSGASYYESNLGFIAR
jgi:quinol monooxygenase YgiN